MARLINKPSDATIHEFGKLGFVGTQKVDELTMQLIDFTKDGIDQVEDIALQDVPPHLSSKSVSWLNVVGLHDHEKIKALCEMLNIHPVVVDKITNTGMRPGFEDHEDYLVITMKLIHLKVADVTIESEHIVFILLDNMVISFQENHMDPFGPLRERLKRPNSRLRQSRTDYFALSLVRAILHEYSTIEEVIGERIENMEDAIFSNDSKELLEDLNTYNTEIAFLNKIIRPTKDTVSNLCRTDSDLIDSERCQYMINHIMDSMGIVSDAGENYRTMLHDHLNIYNTNVANKLNEMFRVLTIFSVIFVPLTFIAGIYGMNFEYIPELGYPKGYFVIWGVMVTMAASMLIYFKRKGWL